MRADTSQVRKWANQFGSWIQIELPKITEQQAREGKKYAREIAPIDTGELIRAIGIREGDSKSYTIVSRTPSGKSNPRKVPYQVYLHEGKAVNIRNSRRQRYMNETYDYIKKSYPNRVERALDKQINK